MALSWRLIAALHIFLFNTFGLGQTITTSVTTLAAASCGTPTCTVTPEAVTDLKIQPSPTTVNVPGRIEPLVFSFASISVSSFQPDPTRIANRGTGVLTLGSTTITDFPSASATQSYTVDGETSVTLTAAVTVKVQAEAQLFIAEESDPFAACALFPQLSQRRDLFRSRVTRALQKHDKRRLFTDKTTTPRATRFINQAADEARTVVASFLQYFNGIQQISAAQATQIGLFKWLPPTIPGSNGQSTFNRLITTVQTLSTFLNSQQGFEFVVTALDDDDDEDAMNAREAACRDEDGEENIFASTGIQDETCHGLTSYTIVCPLAYNENSKGNLDDSLATAAQDLIVSGDCNQDLEDNLNHDEIEFTEQKGARAALILHEMLHLATVGRQAGWPVEPVTDPTNPGNVRMEQTFANWNKDIPDEDSNPEIYPDNPNPQGGFNPMRLTDPTLMSPAQQIVNAPNWEFTFMEFYMRRTCRFTTDGTPWPDLGNGQ